ncbi:MAG: 50S ribosomal protein L9, partial [Lachnospiraceae bacterium]|nr:50S ribosomal protein L9 [Lachnospiraceae bacterium]
MQIVLLEDVKSLGKKGDVVKANDGYARNYILPKKLGVEATPQNLAKLKQQKNHEAKVAAKNLADAQALARAMEAKTGVLKAKVG